MGDASSLSVSICPSFARSLSCPFARSPVRFVVATSYFAHWGGAQSYLQSLLLGHASFLERRPGVLRPDRAPLHGRDTYATIDIALALDDAAANMTRLLLARHAIVRAATPAPLANPSPPWGVSPPAGGDTRMTRATVTSSWRALRAGAARALPWPR